MSYDARGVKPRHTVEIRNNPLASRAAWPQLGNGRPDFAHMTPAQRNAYDKARLDGMFG